MNRENLKVLISDLERAISELKAEVYSDVDAYQNSKAFNPPKDYDELYDDDDGYAD